MIVPGRILEVVTEFLARSWVRTALALILVVLTLPLASFLPVTAPSLICLVPILVAA
jgi:hypothetical protein